MKTVRFYSVFAMASLGCLVCAGCVETDPVDYSDNILIGALLPFTGNAASSGSNLERVLHFAAQQANEAGDIAGHKLQVVARDTHTDITRGVAAVEELIDRFNIRALIGPDDANLAYEIAKIAAEKNIVTISGSMELTQPLHTLSNGYFFKTAPTSQALANGLAQKIIEHNIKKTVVIHLNNQYGIGFANSLVNQFSKLGGQGMQTFPVSVAQASFDSLISDVVAVEPDAIVLIASVTIGAAIVQQTSSRIDHVAWFLSPSLKKDAFLQNVVPGTLEGAIGITSGVPPDFETFSSRFSNFSGGDYPLDESYFYYDAFAITSLAMKASAIDAGNDTFSSQDIRDNMVLVSASQTNDDIIGWYDLRSAYREIEDGNNIDYRGASGAVDLNEQGEVGDSLVRIWKIADNEIVDVGNIIAHPL